MKLVILAGGLETHLPEETIITTKPMIEIGGRPIIWHIIKYYAHFEINEFIIGLRYKGDIIKVYFANYFLHTTEVTIDLKNNNWKIHQNNSEPMTGGRLKRVCDYISDDTFCFTYGDGLANTNIHDLIETHPASGKMATVTAVQSPGRYSVLQLGPIHRKSSSVISFQEKPMEDGSWINGSYFVLPPQVIELITSDATPSELEPLETLASLNQLKGYNNSRFWQPIDTLRDIRYLEKLCKRNEAFWKIA